MNDEETPEEKRRRLGRERQQRWRARQSQGTLDRLRRENNERMSQRLNNETQQQTQARRLANAQSQKRRREQKSLGETQARRLANAKSQQQRRQQETEGQRRARRESDARAHHKARKKQYGAFIEEAVKFDEQVFQRSCEAWNVCQFCESPNFARERSQDGKFSGCWHKAVWYLETRGQFINTEHGEETGGFSDGDDRVNKEDLQAESEERLRAYHCSLRPAEACHPQGDHPVTASCAEVEVVLEDMNKEPRIKQELEDNTGSAVWMAAKVEHKPFSQSALQHWETRGSFIKMECGEETAGFSEGDHQAKKEDLQAESEESLRAYRSSLRPAEACHPQGDHPVTASCAEVEVELEDIQEGSARLACDICGRSYASQDSLQRHAQLHEGYVGTKRHRCRLSPYAMEFVAEPHQHKKAHDGALLHGCGECGRAFTMASQLKVHLRVHAVKKSNYVGCEDGMKTTAFLPKPESPMHAELAEDGTQIDRRGNYKLLTLAKKVEIISKLRHGETVASIVAKYGIGRSTVYDIRRMADKILGYVASMDRLAEPTKYKRITKATLADLNNAIFEWFHQMQTCGVYIDSPTLCFNAVRLHMQMKVEEPFEASSDWLRDFSSRYGISPLPAQVEQPPVFEPSEMDPLKVALEEARQAGLTREQVYNAVDTGIFWKHLPSRSMASHNTEASSDSEGAGYRVMVLMCANASGTHRLRLAVVGKAKWLRAFKGPEALPVDYYTRYSMHGLEAAMLRTWFKQRFVPAVQHHLRAKNLPERAVLFVDHVRWRTQGSIESDCGHIRLVWLPAGYVSPLLPMWSSVIRAFKRHYRWRLLGRILLPPPLPDAQGMRALRSSGQHSINDALVDIAAAWEDVRSEILQKYWTKLWKSDEPDEANRAETARGVKDDLHFDSFVSEATEEPSTAAFLERIKQLPTLCDVAKTDVEKWLIHDDEMEEKEMFEDLSHRLSRDKQIKHSELIVQNEDHDSGEGQMDEDGEWFVKVEAADVKVEAADVKVEAADAKAAACTVLKYMEQCGDFDPEICKQMQNIVKLISKHASESQNNGQ